MSTRLDPNRWACEDCDTVTHRPDLLVAAHPFDADDEVYGCPACRGMDLTPVCDAAGCTRRVSCGTPTPEGYRSTCYGHRPKEDACHS